MARLAPGDGACWSMILAKDGNRRVHDKAGAQMQPSRSRRVVSKMSNGLTDLIEKVIHPGRGAEHDDPSRPFTPPPSQPSKSEDEDDDGGPNFPMDPALA